MRARGSSFVYRMSGLRGQSRRGLRLAGRAAAGHAATTSAGVPARGRTAVSTFGADSTRRGATIPTARLSLHAVSIPISTAGLCASGGAFAAISVSTASVSAISAAGVRTAALCAAASGHATAACSRRLWNTQAGIRDCLFPVVTRGASARVHS